MGVWVRNQLNSFLGVIDSFYIDGMGKTLNGTTPDGVIITLGQFETTARTMEVLEYVQNKIEEGTDYEYFDYRYQDDGYYVDNKRSSKKVIVIPQI